MRKVYMAVNDAGKELGLSFAPKKEGDLVLVSLSSRVLDFDMSYDIQESDLGVKIVSETGQPPLTLRNLTLDDAKEIFPQSPRTFKSSEDFENFVYDKLRKETSYTVQEAPTDVYSFTIEDSGRVLELINVDDEGNMFVRDNGEWLEVEEDEDYPTIYDQSIIDVEPEDYEKVLNFWDEAQVSGTEVTKDEILVFAAIVQ